MSLINILKKKSKIDFFTTPSHAQKFFIFSKFRQFYKYDISETDAYNPLQALNLAQEYAGKIYGTKSTYFLTNGSTSGIIAAVLACVKTGEKVLIWDNAHSCHKNAVKLAGAIPVSYEVEKDETWGIYLGIDIEKIEEQLKCEKIKAVIVTSPTYDGVVSDIKKIKEICKKHGCYLIVDEAHGAMYPFCDKLPESAISLGADFVIQSLHKTAGGLNPTALLHCNAELDTKSALNMISTTSPSYPLLASIEKNIKFLNSPKGRKKILELIKNIENLKKNVPNCEFYAGSDPTKILVKVHGLSGFELSEYLFKNGIEDEKTNEKSTMLLCGIGTDFKKLKKLERVLKKI
ncbi:MAG: aminotransferase class I/II-fold pyridoxal phosphate-dependent enzyme [Candidatus Gastranaerophilaceae bacterium]